MGNYNQINFGGLSATLPVLAPPTRRTGTIQPGAGVSEEDIPKQGWLYGRRLDDGRERYILVESVDPGPPPSKADFLGIGLPP